MNISRRVVISILVTAIVLFAGCFSAFHPEQHHSANCIGCVDTFTNFVFSIDQKYFWTAVILVVVIFLFRLLPHSSRRNPIQIPTR